MTQFSYSKYTRKFLGDCGILRLMDDLGKGANNPDTIMLGGGNPSHIPGVQAVLRDRMAAILDSENDFEKMIGNYAGPSGHAAFAAALAEMFHTEFGWDVGPENIVLTNGSQTAFYYLFNMFGGTFPDGQKRRILLPLAPEYIGYADAGIEEDLFVSYRPQFEYFDDHLFKYHVDFDNITIDDTIGAICVSRPTNPTGNVLTEDEIDQLSDLAEAHGIPLIVDNAYGTPFPGIIFTAARPTWAPHIVMCMSLSKLGLPGARTGIIIAHEEIARAMTGINAVMSLAPGNFGAQLALDLVRSREILRLSHEVVKPHYQAKAEQAVAWYRAALGDHVPYHIHKPEGAIFLWLWFKDLPITSYALYERLMARNVVVVPGHYFFPGLKEPWRHKNECIRMSYAQPADAVERGIAIIAEEVKRAWSGVTAPASA